MELYYRSMSSNFILHFICKELMQKLSINVTQAPSLLITLINMFLEIASAPKVPHPEDPTNSENEYSVFGPSQATAAVQVLSCVGMCYVVLLECAECIVYYIMTENFQ